jgi:hypothetical protein
MTARQNAPDRAETARHGANGIASVSDTVKTGNQGFRASGDHSNCEPGSPLMCAECAAMFAESVARVALRASRVRYDFSRFYVGMKRRIA